MNAKDGLRVFWCSDDGHIEVPGVYIYSFFSIPRPAPDNFSASEIWSRLGVESCVSRVAADNGVFLVVTIRAKNWPADREWRYAIRTTFKMLLALGALVVWCGDEYCSWSLEELEPATTGGCVYAAASTACETIMHSDLSDEIEFLSAEDLLRLKSTWQM